jgi:NAD+--asparagine ADP-ribosyltransferase
MRMTRGKNDKVDTKRIAIYAYEKRERLKPNTQSPENIISLKRLLSFGIRMVKQRAEYKTSLKEQSEILFKKENKLLFKLQKNVIKSISKEIETIDYKSSAKSGLLFIINH